MWVKIKAAVDNLGPDNTNKQCKDKMQNLKDAYNPLLYSIKQNSWM